MSCMPVHTHELSPNTRDNKDNNFNNYNIANNTVPFYVSVALVPFINNNKTLESLPIEKPMQLPTYNEVLIPNPTSNDSISNAKSSSDITKSVLFPTSHNVTFDTENVDKAELLSPNLSISTSKYSDRLSYYSTPMSIRNTIDESVTSDTNLDFDIPILPFWFGGEESLHCKRILDKYVTLNNIKIQSTYSKSRRAPLVFNLRFLIIIYL